jgi:inner membrane protein
MTARTHDLFAFTGLTLVVVLGIVPSMSPATAICAIGVNFLGGLFPDLDKSTSQFWKHIRGGTIIGKIIAPLIGGHRNITHSLLGVFLTYTILTSILPTIGKIFLLNMEIIKYAFLIGYGSHLIADAMTTEGIPLLFPFQKMYACSPIKILRIKTGGFREKWIIFPGLLLLNGYIFYIKYAFFIAFLTNILKTT